MATGRDLRARLVLSLNDRASPGLRPIPGRLDRISAALRRISLAAAVVGGLSLLGPMQQAVAFEDALRQNAITAGQTGAALEEMIQRTRGAYERLARETGQRSRDIAAAAGSLVAAGLNDQAIQALMPTLARVATATAASMEDLSQTAFQLQQQMGLTAEQMPRAFATLIQAGRDGNFELRDMAREFPNILTFARALGMTGQGAVTSLAAALQVARMGAGTSSEAATNLLNALQKLASPETRRGFREIGVDLEAVLNDASRRGINPMEAVIQKLRERTGGNLNRLSELFADRQALMGLLPLITETQRYLEIRDRAAQASPQVIDESFADRMRGAQMQMNGFLERLEQLHRRFLLVVGTALEPLNAGLDRLFEWIGQIDAQYPGLIDNTMAWLGGLVALAAGLGALGQVLSFLGAGLTLVTAPLRLVFVALAGIAGLKLAIIVGVIAALAGVAYLIWRNWDRVVAVFRAVQDAWNRFASGEQVEWLRSVLAGAVRAVGSAWEFVGRVFAQVRDAIVADIQRIVENIQPLIRAIQWLIDHMPSAPGTGGTAFTPQAQAERGQRMNAMGAQRIPDALWNAPEDAAPPRPRDWQGRVVLELGTGLVAREANTNTPQVSIVPDRGATRSRP